MEGRELRLLKAGTETKVIPGRTQRDYTWSQASTKVSFPKVLSETTSFSNKYRSQDFDETGWRPQQLAHLGDSVMHYGLCVVPQHSQIADNSNSLGQRIGNETIFVEEGHKGGPEAKARLSPQLELQRLSS